MLNTLSGHASSRQVRAFQDRTGVAVDVRSVAYLDRWLRDPDGTLPLPVLDQWYRDPKKGLVLPLWCAIAFVNSASAASGGAALSGAASMDTTGANFLVALVAEFGSTRSNVTDSKNAGNWTNLSAFGLGGSYGCHIAYRYNPGSVGAGHTISTDQANFPAVAWMAFSGLATASDPYDATAGTAGANTADSGATSKPGSLTATTANSLYFSGYCNTQTSTGTSTPTGFSTPVDVASALEGAAAYIVSSSAQNPTWTHSSSGATYSTMAIFAPPAAGGGRGLFLPPPVTGVGIGGSFFRNPLQSREQALRRWAESADQRKAA